MKMYAFLAVFLLIVSVVLLISFWATMPKPEPSTTITREHLEIIRAKSPEWADALEPFVDQPIPKSLASSLLTTMLNDIHGVK